MRVRRRPHSRLWLTPASGELARSGGLGSAVASVAGETITRMTELSRQPPAAVKRQLRQEVGFGCPMPGCGNPFLEYHHFDPPWSQENHYDPDRMIAVYATHHAKAGALTVDQCRELKQTGADRA
jgi:hypothetical protein